MQKLLKTYQNRLTNLTSANRSLLLLRLPKSQFLDLFSLNFIENQPAFDIIKNLIAGRKKIELCQYLDPRSQENNELSKQLRQIARTDQMLQEERGAEDLYVGYPIVKGKMLDGTPIRCPLLFFGVTLHHSANQWYISPKNDISINRSFLMAFSHFNKIKLDDHLLECNFDEFPDNARAFLTQLYETLKGSSLEINFNADLFDEKLGTFEQLKKEDLNAEKNGEIKLYSQAVLGIFPQAGSYIASDYEHLLGKSSEYQVVEDFFGTAQEYQSGALKEEKLMLPMPADSSQEATIAEVKKGKSIVVQGPPGTGKSQLIANLMADFAGRGKKVLLVCQKRAAIDTVYQRLEKEGLGAFAALVHDFRSDRNSLYQKIGDQIDKILAYKHENQQLNAIFLEREFDAISRKIDQKLGELDAFKDALYNDKHFGRSAKELYLLAAQGFEKKLDLSDAYRAFHFNDLDTFLKQLDELEKYDYTLENQSNEAVFWQKRHSFAHMTSADLGHIKTAISQLIDFKKFSIKINLPFSLENMLPLMSIAKIDSIIKTNEDFEILKAAMCKELNTKELNLKMKKLIEIQDEGVKDTTESEHLLAQNLAVLEAAQQQTTGVFRRIMWQVFAKNKQEVAGILGFFDLTLKRDNLLQGIESLNVLIATRCLEKELLPLDIKNRNVVDLITLVESRIKIAELADYFREHGFFVNRNWKELSYEAFQNDLQEWLANLKKTESRKENWRKYLTETQIETINQDVELSVIRYLIENYENICARDSLFDSLKIEEKSVYLQTKSIFKDKLAFYFFQNLIHYFIEDLEEKYPQLREVSSLKLKFREEELQQLVLKKQKLAKDNLLIKLRENTYKNIEKNRLGNATTYRDLKHQTSKKKQVWSVRKIVEEFSHELFDLVPCWMASPETVSAIFPIEKGRLFDLVIFDEASQCYTETGLPAMLRGNQIVIAGDSKQLQPSDLYRIKYEEDTDQNTLLEIDSLLQFGELSLPNIMLTGHYRSRSHDLIGFSNRHFYGGKLKLLPEFKDVNSRIPAIAYQKVEGLWQDNQNVQEAEAVEHLVNVLVRSENDKSIGIVTFNYKQADLIAEKLDKFKQVSVKNIENIQGDEFDIVIFSVGYGPNDKGKVLLNFGSLSQPGGENRLNVAVSRAREKIYIVASIYAEDLKLAEGAAQGAQLLKAYLQYAQNVALGQYIPEKTSNLPGGWGIFLKDFIIKNKENISEELPFADLVEKQEENYGELILTDDELFYNTRNAKEAFAHLPLMLQAKGWQYRREWSRNWWLKPS